MLEWCKISPSQQQKSLGISSSDFAKLASKSLGLKVENGQVTWRKNSKWLGLQDSSGQHEKFLSTRPNNDFNFFPYNAYE